MPSSSEQGVDRDHLHVPAVPSRVPQVPGQEDVQLCSHRATSVASCATNPLPGRGKSTSLSHQKLSPTVPLDVLHGEKIHCNRSTSAFDSPTPTPLLHLFLGCLCLSVQIPRRSSAALLPLRGHLHFHRLAFSPFAHPEAGRGAVAVLEAVGHAVGTQPRGHFVLGGLLDRKSVV